MSAVHRVVALALPRVTVFDLATAAEIFGHRDERHRYSFRCCTPAPGLVDTNTSIPISIPLGLGVLATADTIVVPGYDMHDEPAPEALEALRAAAANGKRIMSICNGAFALAAAGLLNGRRATTHWRDAADLAARYPQARIDADVLYVADDLVMTSAGLAAGIDLCVHVVRLDHGEQIAADVARRLVVAPHRTAGQAQFLQRPAPPGDAGLAATRNWALSRMDQPLTVADLARHAGWAPRTFARRFRAETGTTPTQWLTAQRVLEARRLLELTDLPVDRVAASSGLGTAANLRTKLNRDTHTNPSTYRQLHRNAMKHHARVQSHDR